MSRFTVDDVAKQARDAAYVGVGLGVLAFQRAQVRRKELLRTSSSTQVSDAKQSVSRLLGQVDNRVRMIEERLEAVEEQLEAAIDRVETHLPDPFVEASRTARAAAKATRTQVRALAARTNG
jgi:hypothetical protein